MMKWIIGIMALSLILLAASVVLDTRNMTVSSSEPTEQEQAIEQIGTAMYPANINVGGTDFEGPPAPMGKFAGVEQVATNNTGQGERDQRYMLRRALADERDE